MLAREREKNHKNLNKGPSGRLKQTCTITEIPARVLYTQAAVSAARVHVHELGQRGREAEGRLREGGKTLHNMRERRRLVLGE